MRRLAALLLAIGIAGCTASPVTTGQRFPVFFRSFSTQLDANAQAAVASATTWARRYPSATVTVVGYADPRANRQMNEELAMRRARSVTDLLVRDGVPPGRIKPGIGDATLLPLSAQADRRVDISFGPP